MSVKKPIDCFKSNGITKISTVEKNGRVTEASIEDYFNSIVATGKTEAEAAREIIIGEHKKVFDKMERLKGAKGVYQEPLVDNTKIKEINDKYEKDLSNLQVKVGEKVKTTNVSNIEPPLPKGEVIVTLSGMTESERQQKIAEREGKTGITEEQKTQNQLAELAYKADKLTYSAKKEAQAKLRQRVRSENAEAGYEKYQYNGVHVQKRVVKRTGSIKGHSVWRKISAVNKDIGNQSIKKDAVVLRDRSVELQNNFDNLVEVVPFLELEDANGRKMSADQLNLALEDVYDGIPSVQAENLLNVLETALAEDNFPIKDNFTNQRVRLNDLLGVSSEIIGEPLTQEGIEQWLNDESGLSEEQEDLLNDELQNIIYDYNEQGEIELPISETIEGGKEAGNAEIKPDAVAEEVEGQQLNPKDETGNNEENEAGGNEQPQPEIEVEGTPPTEAGGTINEAAPQDGEQVPQPKADGSDGGVVPPQTPTEEVEDNDDLDYLFNNVKTIAAIGTYLSDKTIIKYTGEAPTNDQTIQGQDLLSALESGVAIIEKAKEMWGDRYVEKMLDYIENSKADTSNKALGYVSLENAVNADKAAFPEREAELNKLLELVHTESQNFGRELSKGLNYFKLRKFATVGYDISQVTEHFFAPEEISDRKKIEDAVQAPISEVQKAYEEQLQANEDLKKRNEELEKRVANNYGDARIQERKLKLADKLDKIAERVANFGRVSGDVVRNSIAPDFQKYVADAIHYVATEIRAGKEIPAAILDAAKKFANDKLKPDFLKKQIEDGLKEAGFTTKEIAKTSTELKEDKERRDDILAFKDKNGKTPKEIITDALIAKGFGKTMTVKGEKIQILDWKKLAGRAGTEEEISRNVEEVVKDIEGLSDEIQYAKDLFIQEIKDLREGIILKSITELKRKNRDAITVEQRSAAKRLAELYSLGLFDKAEDEFDNALNKAVGINVTEENYAGAKEIARGLERIFTTSFKGGKLNETSAKFALEQLNNKLRLLLIDETIKQGSSSLRVANIVRSYFDISQTMILMNMKQTIENPLSGLQGNVLEIVEDVLSGSSTADQRKQRTKQMKNVAVDMITQGGMGYGDVENLFVNRKHLDDSLNNIAGDSKIAHSVLSAVSGRVTLNTMDAMFKFSITEKKFTHNLIKILTDKTNPNRMEKEDAVRFVSEKLTGQTFEDAKVTAKETIDTINEEAGKNLIPDNQISIERFANDIVKGALMMGGKLTTDQITAAYNAAYRNAGLNIGHVSNNFLSKMIVGASAQLENKISVAIKRKQWRRAAAYTYSSIFFRNVLNPFVGGGTNWIVLRAEKMGIGLFTGLGYNLFAEGKELDLADANDLKSIEKALYNQARAKDSFMRGLIGGTITWSMYAAFKALNDDEEEEKLAKLRKDNRWAARYTDIVTSEAIVASMAWKNKEVGRYVGSWFNKNDAFDPVTKMQRAAAYAAKGQDGKMWGAIGELSGMNFNTPVPWRIVKDGVVIYQGTTGQDPYHGDYKPSQGFFNGVFQGGLIEFLGWRPKKDEKPKLKPTL